MFSMKIVDSDPFKEMPLSAQALYFHLAMNADDEGFVNNAKSVQRSIMASDDDMKLLIAKSFLIYFDSGIVVIKHWKMHNTIQPSRLKPTQYIEERNLLEVNENKSYTLNLSHISPLLTDCQQNDSKCQQTVSKCQQNVAENRIEENRREEKSVVESECTQQTPDSAAYKALIKQYGKEFVDERIERAKLYKGTNNMDTVAKWCAEDFKRQKSKHNQNTFNSFPQRPYDFWDNDNNDDLIVINQPNDSS